MAAIFGKEEAARQEEFAQFPEEESGRPLWKTVTYMAGMVVFLVFANWAAPKTPNSFWETVYSMKWILAGAGLTVTVLASLTWFNKEERGEWFSSTWGYALLLVFGLVGTGINFFAPLFAPLTVLVLCFIMGLQNAVITKISHAEIRTTHITGLLTDLGIELGKLFYINRFTREHLVDGNRQKIRLHLSLITSFFIGGVMGALGFKYIGFISTVPLAVLLFLLVWRPVLNDARHWIDPQRQDADD